MDWRRIQGRIRKARTSKDPAAELAALYTGTRDAMVAFELARLYEQNGNSADAVQWYSTAASRFRRAQWKVKAQEALTRLGAEVPLAASEAEAEAASGSAVDEDTAHPLATIPLVGSGGDEMETPEAYTEGASEPKPRYGGDLPEEDESEGQIALLGVNAAGLNRPRPQSADESGRKRRRRGRRGGARRKKRGDRPGAAGAGRAGFSPATPSHPHHRPPQHSRPETTKRSERVERIDREPREQRQEIAAAAEVSAPAASAATAPAQAPVPVPSEPVAHEVEGRIGPAAYQARTRVADPALASRTAQLESQMRRLLGSHSHPVADADKAPAGPGVFVVSDSDMSMSSYYYVEACQTLRIGIGNVVRSGRSREGANIKEKMAEHLGINESRVSAYLKEHCIVRWIQLDDGAAHLAHFAIAILRPIVNE